MATVRIPTPLRKLTDGAEEVAASGTTVGELIADLEKKLPRHQGAHLRRDRRGAPLRQHLRQGRGHPLPAEPRHAGQGQRRGLDRPGDRRRLIRADALHRRRDAPLCAPDGAARSGRRRAGAPARARRTAASEVEALYLAAAGVGTLTVPVRRRLRAAVRALNPLVERVEVGNGRRVESPSRRRPSAIS